MNKNEAIAALIEGKCLSHWCLRYVKIDFIYKPNTRFGLTYEDSRGERYDIDSFWSNKDHRFDSGWEIYNHPKTCPFTGDELVIWESLIENHNKFMRLDRMHPMEVQEWVDAIHRLQGILEHRGMKRAFPDFYNKQSNQ